jgi:hypothetical protein
MLEKPGFPAYSWVSREACGPPEWLAGAGGIDDGETKMVNWRSDALAVREKCENLFPLKFTN